MYEVCTKEYICGNLILITDNHLYKTTFREERVETEIFVSIYQIERNWPHGVGSSRSFKRRYPFF